MKASYRTKAAVFDEVQHRHQCLGTADQACFQVDDKAATNVSEMPGRPSYRASGAVISGVKPQMKALTKMLRQTKDTFVRMS